MNVSAPTVGVKIDPLMKQRLQRFQQEKSAIDTHPGLSPADKQAAIQRLAQEQFDERERLRLDASAQLASARQNNNP